MSRPIAFFRARHWLAAALIVSAAGVPTSPVLAATSSPTCKFLETSCEQDAQQWQNYFSKSSAPQGNAADYPTVATCQIIYGQAISHLAWPSRTPLQPNIPCTP